jgi:hypothetical protein
MSLPVGSAEDERLEKEYERELKTVLIRRLIEAERRLNELSFQLDIAKGNIDAWEKPIKEWLERQPGRRHITRHILSNALEIDESDQDHQARLRLAKIMRKLGWDRTIISTEDGLRGKGWVKRGYG